MGYGTIVFFSLWYNIELNNSILSSQDNIQIFAKMSEIHPGKGFKKIQQLKQFTGENQFFIRNSESL